MSEKRLRVKTVSIAITTILFTSMFFALAATPVRADSSVSNLDTLVYAMVTHPDRLDPARDWESVGWMILRNCYDTLLDYAPDEDYLVPGLATEVPTVENGGISPDGLTYRFHIRSGVMFPDGTPLAAEDVEYSIERAMVYADPWGPSYMLSEFLTGYSPDAILDSVEVEGSDVIFHLIQPHSPFLEILTTPLASVISKQWCIDGGDWPGTLETIPEYYNPPPAALDTATMGAGPFTVESWTDDSLVLSRNDFYWRGPAKLERVELRIVPNWEIRKQMFLDGVADVIVNIPAYAYPELDSAEGVRVYTGLQTLTLYGSDLNLLINPVSGFIGSGELDGNGIPVDFFDDLDIRKAFAYSTNYQGLIDEIWGGEAEQPATVVIEGLPYHNPDQEKYHLDLDQAEFFFQQAMEGRVWEKGFTFAIPYDSGNMMRKAIAESFKKHIELINPTKFHIEVVGVSWADYWGAMFNREIPIMQVAWAADYRDPDNLVYAYMQTDGVYAARRGYSDPYVDGLIYQGRYEIDPTVRQLVYFELQQIYHDDVVGIPIAQILRRHYERTWVAGWVYNPITSTDFYQMWKDPGLIISQIEELVESGVLKSG
ncbi:MAG: ABC transporter substrate-binding protein, partial [Candidatus Thorarchaeota archaeon]